MYKYYKIITNRLMLRKVLIYFNNNLDNNEIVISPRPLPQQFVVSNIIFIKVKVNSKNYNRVIKFNNINELLEEEFIAKTSIIDFKW